MERMAWTDERLDDFAQEMRDFRRETREEFRALRSELRGEIGSLRAEFGGEIGSLRAEITGLRADMTRFAFGFAGAFFLQLIAVVMAIVFGR